jgi:hypothetical protein
MVNVEAPCRMSIPGQTRFTALVLNSDDEVDEGVGLGKKKSAIRAVIDGELAEAEEAASDAGAEEELKIRSVEQPVDSEAKVSAATTAP